MQVSSWFFSSFKVIFRVYVPCKNKEATSVCDHKKKKKKEPSKIAVRKHALSETITLGYWKGVWIVTKFHGAANHALNKVQISCHYKMNLHIRIYERSFILYSVLSHKPQPLDLHHLGEKGKVNHTTISVLPQLNSILRLLPMYWILGAKQFLLPYFPSTIL